MVDHDPVSSRVLRLEAVKALLADRDVTTVGDLAADLGVSMRTVQRDLVALRDLGMPIESDRGRGGGIRLEPGWSLGRVHLNESEALGMLLSLTIAEKIGSPLLLDDLRSVRRKVSAAFAPAQSRRIRALRRRVLVGGPASDRVLTTYTPPQASITQGLMRAFLYQHVASIRYQDQSGTVTDREIETQYLYYNLPVWYALAWDRLREDVRFFRLDRLQRIQALAADFRLRPPDPFLKAGEPEARTM
ncbi:MAG TPA: WYL domain-containing protein [Propionibacteriaceae bacterium]|jgi:predicted DNA-binding transcriptional regulator YafY|nr:WYL domain-containing protein [Propionibacteriaceae bacterium]